MINLLSIYAGVSGQSQDDILCEFSGKQFSDLKKGLTDLLVQKICPIGNEMNKIINEKEYIGNILKDGAEKAKAIAQPVLEETKKIIGLT